MRITLRQLGVFVAIARYGTVTRAAHELNLTQSAASMALADLETQLDCLLFRPRRQAAATQRPWDGNCCQGP
jgi:DNA-binding transcriptional LysR family regulator